MKGSRITAVGLVAAAGLWIASGHFMPHESAESRAAIRPGENEVKKLFRVAIMSTKVEQHNLRLTISGRTEADKRVMVTARTGGVLTELRVKRGSSVKENEIIADGVWWRRALDPGFDPASVVPIFMDITRHMLRSRPQFVRKEKDR